MPGQDCLDFLEVTARRDDDPTGTHDRLGKEGGDGIRALGQDQPLQFIGAAAGEIVFAFAG